MPSPASVSGCPAAAELSRFAHQKLEAQSAAAVQAHLQVCAPCRQLVDESKRKFSSGSRYSQSTISLRGSTDDVLAVTVATPAGPLSALERYRIGEKIASGGMGVVHRATDLLFKREVAVKLLHPKLRDQPQALEAFRYEAEITARLQHPGIPPIHDLGRFEDGLPLLAMKLIQGKTLHDLLAARSSPQEDLPRWLQVFEQIAQAVGYAHSQGILHRDLKPPNVMVGQFGEVQVMDWGLAKVVGTPERDDLVDAGDTPGPGDIERHFVSEAGNVKGTLRYMAPEQARGEIDTLDARSDVFGLGAILCQILTGEPPYSGQTPKDILAVAMAGDLGEASDRIKASGADPEITHLALRCLSPHADGRPANGSEVAVAVAAHRSSVEQRLRQAETARALSAQQLVEQTRRRKLWYGIAAALLLLVAASSSLAMVYARSNTIIADREAKATAAAELATKREKEAQLSAQREAAAAKLAAEREVKAKLEAATSLAVGNFLEDDLLAFAGPDEQAAAGIQMNPDLKVRDLMLRAADKIEGKFQNQPLVEMRLRLTLGSSLSQVGETKRAIQQFERAHELSQQHPNDEDPDQIFTTSNLAMAYRTAGRVDLSIPLYEQSLQVRTKKYGPEHPLTLNQQTNLANAYITAGQQARGVKLLEDTLQIQQEKLGPDHEDTLYTRMSLGQASLSFGPLDRSLPLLEETLQMQERKLGPEHPDTLRTMADIANGYSSQGRADRALELRRKVYETQRAKLGEDHPETLLSLGNLANSLLDVGNPQEALPLFKKTVELMRVRFGHMHPTTLGNLANWGSALHEVGQDEEALPLCKEALQGQRKVIGSEHPITVDSVANLGSVHYSLGQFEQAIPLFEEAIATRRKVLGPTHRLTCDAMGKLALTLADNGDLEAGRDLYREALAIRLKTVGPQHKDTIFNLGFLSMIEIKLKEHAAAEEHLLAAWDAGQTLPSPLKEQVLFATAGELYSLFRDTNKPRLAQKWLAEMKKVPEPKRGK